MRPRLLVMKSTEHMLKEAWTAGYCAALHENAVSEEEDEIAESVARGAYERHHAEASA